MVLRISLNGKVLKTAALAKDNMSEVLNTAVPCHCQFLYIMGLNHAVVTSEKQVTSGAQTIHIHRFRLAAR